jgi:hypothetical protein
VLTNKPKQGNLTEVYFQKPIYLHQDLT